VSDGPYASLNLGRLTADDPAKVEENRRILCDAVNADHNCLAMNRQVHGAVVNRAQPAQRDVAGDGLWTDEPGLPMLKLTADCLPIALVRADGRPALALLHAGRLGLLDGIVAAGAAAIGTAARAMIGPGIGPCCYAVGEDIREAYRGRFGDGVIAGRNLDLWTAAERALHEAGVEDVERADVCTACNPDEYFSHRRDAGATGRQGVIGYLA
ncbi:MAG: polyphenol oxidase family protein, partial [Actinobacteria bacterium]|nr:polyphenol oxidase family protein [Actinomycetota bacterium]